MDINIHFLRLKVLLLVLLLTALPWVYAHTVMESPCDPKEEKFNTKTWVVVRVGCETQEWLRSDQSLIFGVLCVIGSCIFAVINFYLVEILRRASPGSTWVYTLAYWHSYTVFKSMELFLRSRIPRIFYASQPIMKLPGVMIPISSAAFVTLTIETLIIQFMLVALRHGSVATLAVVALAFISLYMSLIEKMVGASDQVLNIIESELHQWDLARKGDKIIERMQAHPAALCLTYAEIEALADLLPDEEVPAMFMIVHEIYIVDRNARLNLLSGKVVYLT